MALPRKNRHREAAGFDFTAAIRRLCLDICARLPELAHVDMTRVAVSFCQTRKNVPHGMQAALTPLRFEGGAMTGMRYGRRYACQTVRDAAGHEYLYIVSFYLPRFLNHCVEEKLATVVHELWHISPAFDGDLRRHAGRCYAHGNSQHDYDAHVEQITRQWLSLDPPHALYAFLELNYEELVAQHGPVYGQRVATPRLVPV